MARSIQEIQQSIIDAKNADATLSAELTSESATAIWLLWSYIVAFCQRIIEVFYDSHKGEVVSIIKLQKPHTLSWYEQKAKAFQYGYTLPSDSDVYDTIDASAQIIKYAAAVEITPFVRIKVAKATGQLSDAELAAFKAYIKRIKDAGVRDKPTSGPKDDLQAAYKIYYDPLVFNELGQRLDGTNDTPVLSAVVAYINAMPFNGLFVANRLIEALRNVDGVVIPEPILFQAKYGLLPYTAFVTEYIPDAGYMLLDEAYFSANTIYVPHNPI